MKVDDKIYDYKHANGKISIVDLKKEWCLCVKMFDRGNCCHLVRVALEEDCCLPGMLPKSKNL